MATKTVDKDEFEQALAMLEWAAKGLAGKVTTAGQEAHTAFRGGLEILRRLQ